LVKPTRWYIFAAESQVDRGVLDSSDTFETNVRGTVVLLDAAKKAGIERFLHVSTDEVYGDMWPDRFAVEASLLRTSSPYAASKAAAKMLVMAYQHTYGLPALIIRASNNYGPFQFPEKFMPLMITNAMESKRLPVCMVMASSSTIGFTSRIIAGRSTPCCAAAASVRFITSGPGRHAPISTYSTCC